MSCLSNWGVVTFGDVPQSDSPICPTSRYYMVNRAPSHCTYFTLMSILRTNAILNPLIYKVWIHEKKTIYNIFTNSMSIKVKLHPQPSLMTSFLPLSWLRAPYLGCFFYLIDCISSLSNKLSKFCNSDQSKVKFLVKLGEFIPAELYCMLNEACINVCHKQWDKLN